MTLKKISLNLNLPLDKGVIHRSINFLSGSFFSVVCFLFPLSAKADVWRIKIDSGLFSDLRDFENIKSSDDFKLTLDDEDEDNEVDISDFVKALNRAKNSSYNNFQLIDEKIKKKIFNQHIPLICEKANDKSDCIKKAQEKIQRAVNSLGKELSKTIRYPHYYRPMDTEEGRKTLSEMEKALTNNKCPPDCRTIHLNNGSQNEFNKLLPLIKKQKSSCLKSIITNMAEQLQYNRPPARCEKNKNHPVCKNMSENYRLFKDRLLRLTEWVYGESARSQTEAKLCLDCSRFADQDGGKMPDPKTLEDLWPEARNCEEIPPGKWKRVSAGTGLSREYIIRRDKDGGYSAVLNLQFVAAKDYKGPVPPEHVSAYYRDHIRRCLKKTNQKMTGPNNEKLRIVLAENPPGKSSCPESEKRIEIGHPQTLSNDRKYASDIDCPTVTHEILHQTGLCDEYLISRRGYIIDTATGSIVEEVENIYNAKLSAGQAVYKKFDCRLTRDNSIMSNQYVRWDNVFDKKTENSLLTPRQFKAVLYGDCKNKNQSFNECSKLAYKNSFEDKNCIKKRKKCEAQEGR